MHVEQFFIMPNFSLASLICSSVQVNNFTLTSFLCLPLKGTIRLFVCTCNFSNFLYDKCTYHRKNFQSCSHRGADFKKPVIENLLDCKKRPLFKMETVCLVLINVLAHMHSCVMLFSFFLIYSACIPLSGNQSTKYIVIAFACVNLPMTITITKMTLLNL